MNTSENSHLLRAWIVLVTLTVISVAGALIGGNAEGSSLAAVLVALVASFVKARQVLDHFLGLRHSSAGWRGFFTALLLLILGAALACHLWGHL